MISASYYYPIYLFLVTIATFFAIIYKKDDKQNQYVAAIILFVFLSIFIGTRPFARIFTDMSNYWEAWMRSVGEPFKFDLHRTNFIFDNMFYAMSSMGLDIYVLFVLMDVIYFGCILWACRKMFHQNVFFSFIVYLAAFSTLSYGTNGIKSGAAAAIFLVAIAYMDKPLVSIILSVISYGFHHSMEVPIIIFYLALFIKRTEYYFALWVLCLFLAVVHFTGAQHFFASLGDEQGASYMLTEGEGFWVASGMRWDFTLYSMIPIIQGWRIIKHHKVRDEKYIRILNLYIACNAFWLLCMYADFTNRIAYLSWFLYPIVLIYPYLKIDIGFNRFKMAKTASYLHLSFTLFMNLIYYNFLH